MDNLFIKNKRSLLFSPFLKENVAAGMTYARLDFSFERDNNVLKRLYGELFRELYVNPKRIISLKQTHSDSIFIFKNGASVIDTPEADAIITDSKNTAILIRVADCVPVFIYDKAKKTSALVHSGWRGTQKLIVVKVVKSMNDLFGSCTQDLIALVGPCIRDCCYEVSNDFKDNFKNISKIGNKYFLDLPQEVMMQLSCTGIAKENIFDCGVCSSCSSYGFYSYRRQKTARRNLCFMVMK